ncbi:hypothetical protein TRFO_31009 [Tritrichomonas foetus]|uniref:Smr domain-containing protein n=1 Tax=Tritrichomonas foetus TaxID=1144522 RepID=A0A1J4JU40_9EUKA|nr:hypothetical protein TRFO_31009 [Tritrichomonas foetus]|eukprot:OHT01992.1 hypothetical protein TRFO_31009 [Tritrichomonas foetus]
MNEKRFDAVNFQNNILCEYMLSRGASQYSIDQLKNDDIKNDVLSERIQYATSLMNDDFIPPYWDAFTQYEISPTPNIYKKRIDLHGYTHSGARQYIRRFLLTLDRKYEADLLFITGVGKHNKENFAMSDILISICEELGFPKPIQNIKNPGRYQLFVPALLEEEEPS